MNARKAGANSSSCRALLPHDQQSATDDEQETIGDEGGALKWLKLGANADNRYISNERTFVSSSLGSSTSNCRVPGSLFKRALCASSEVTT